MTEKRTSKRCPTHPGSILKHDVFPALGLNVSEAAKALGISRNTLHGLIRDENPNSVTTDMAVRIGKLCGNGPRIWVKLQASYDLWHSELRVDVSDIPTLEEVV